MAIAVAVSGGVDSLLALQLLREQGEEVIALHAFLQDLSEDMYRVSKELQDKCAYLNVPFYLLDLRKDFQKLVIEPFVNSYAQGFTPNPCALCNRRVKFGKLLDKARDLGAKKLATGHYARLANVCGQKLLLRGRDEEKEQSYFLALLTTCQLEFVHFPLAEWRKLDTYQALEKKGLSAVNKMESQEICFVTGTDYRDFVLNKMKNYPPSGPIKDSQGNVLGTHQGLYRYTIGQRKGLGISYPEPLYVLKKDTAKNELIVGTKEECISSKCRVKDLNILVDPDKWPEQLFVQTRYRQEAVPAHVHLQDREIKVSFLYSRKPATPGQIAAFYSEQGEILGAGIIDE